MRLSKFALAVAAVAAFSLPAHADDWQHGIALYGWGTTVNSDTSIEGNGGDSEGSGSIFDHLDAAGMLRYEGHGEKWGVLADAIYVGLSYPVKNTPADVDINSTVLELAGSWHANDHLEVLFGGRYMDLSTTLDFDVLADKDADKSWVDAMAGLRVKAPMGEHWRWFLRGDIAGFGSDLTLNGETAFLWDATDHFSLAMGYRYLSVDFDDGSGPGDLELNLQLYGPELGFVFRF